MRQFGTVVTLEGATATVSVRRHASCEKCGACGIGSRPTVEVLARNEIDASIGDSVIMELESRTVFIASAIVYVVPLVLMVLGLLLGPTVFGFLGVGVSPDAASAVLGLTMLVLAFVAVHIYDRKVSPRRYMSRIVALADGTDDPEGCH